MEKDVEEEEKGNQFSSSSGNSIEQMIKKQARMNKMGSKQSSIDSQDLDMGQIKGNLVSKQSRNHSSDESVLKKLTEKPEEQAQPNIIESQIENIILATPRMDSDGSSKLQKSLDSSPSQDLDTSEGTTLGNTTIKKLLKHRRLHTYYPFIADGIKEESIYELTGITLNLFFTLRLMLMSIFLVIFQSTPLIQILVSPSLP